MTDDQYTDSAKWPYTFGNGASNIDEGQQAAAWIAKHPEIKKIGVLSDGTETEQQIVGDITNPLKTAAPGDQIVKTVQISPGSVDVSTADRPTQGRQPRPAHRVARLRLRAGLAGHAVRRLQPADPARARPPSTTGTTPWGPSPDKGVVTYVDCVPAKPRSI